MIKLILTASAVAGLTLAGALYLGSRDAAATPPKGPGAPWSEQSEGPYTAPPGWPYEIDFEGVTGPVSFETEEQAAIPPSYTDLSTIEVGGSAEHY